FLLALLAVPGVAVSVVWAPATFLATAAFGVLARALWSGLALVRGRRPGWGRALLRLVTYPVMLAVSLVPPVVWPGLVAGARAALRLVLGSGRRVPRGWWRRRRPITLAGVLFGIVCGGSFDREVDRAGMRMPGLRRGVLRALALRGGFVAICAAAVRAVVVFL